MSRHEQGGFLSAVSHLHPLHQHVLVATCCRSWSSVSSTNVLSVGGFWRPYLTYISISIMYALVAGGLVSFVEPLAAGSGIAEVKTYLNGVHIRGLLAVRLRA